MIQLVRVDDRLLHGQTLYAWAPYVKADSVVIASDEVDCDAVRRTVMNACSDMGLRVMVKSIKDTVEVFLTEGLDDSRIMLIVSDLRDAMRVYKEGVRFTSLNIGEVHHVGRSRKVSCSVILNKEDEEIIKEFEVLGVKVDFRETPTSPPVPYQGAGYR